MSAPVVDRAPEGAVRLPEPDGEGSSKLFGRGLLYVVVWSLQLVVSTLISPVLAHLVGPAQFGALASGMSVYQVLSVAALFGLDQALVLQRSEDRDDRAARGLISVAVVLSFTVTAAALATIPLWAGPLGFEGYRLLLVAIILWTAPSAVVTVMLALLVAEDRLRAFTAVSIMSAVGGSIVGLVLMLTLGRDATTYAWGGVICQFVAMAIGVVVTKPLLSGFRQAQVTRRAIRLGTPLALSALAYFVLNAGDRIIIQRDLGATEVGRYQVAYVIGSAVILLLNFTNGAWTPHFAALKSDAARYALALRSRDELYRLLVPIVLAVTLVAPLALRILAPATFRPAGLTIVVLLVALTAFPVAASGATGRLLIVQRRGKTLGIVSGVAAVVNVGVNVLLVVPLGIAGAAIATLLSYSLLAALQLRLLPDRRTWRAAPPRLLLAIAGSVTLASLSMLLPETLPWNLARAVLALACLPWFLLRLRDARRGAGDDVPTDIAPTDDVPTDIVPTDDVPTDIVPTDDVPPATVPSDTAPTGTVPSDTAPTGTVPTDGAPTGAVATIDALEALFGEGAVRSIRPGEESTTVTDTAPDVLPDAPGPRRVISVDLDQDVPELVADYRYSTAMVVGYRSDIPVGAVDIELTDDPADAAAALRPLFAQQLPERAADDLPVADADLPSITVVVSTVVGRPTDLRILLDAFERLDYPDVEYVLVDNRVTLPADDLLPGIVAGRNVRVVRESRPGVSTGRNAGVEAARGDVVAFTDDDVRVDENWLRVIGRRFARADHVDAMTGLILPAELETPAQIWFEGYYGGFAGERQFVPVRLEAAGDLPGALRGSKIRVEDPRGTEIKRFPIYGVGAYGAGANMAFRRTALQRVRGFDPALGTGTPALGGEDLATIVQILWTGGRLAFEPAAVVHHRHRRTLPELEKQLHGYGLGFTAMLTALVLGDPRHLVALGWQVPSAAGRLAGRAVDRLRGRSPKDAPQETADLSGGYPKSLVSTELKGFPSGPAAYLRSRRSWLRVERTHEAPGNVATIGGRTRS
ncbi:Putative mycofactocin biosynthesis glycosyltransferase MftF [Frondihabitans sp. 762G35]|uniref:oligosaccharide flippase family protein n=1 Tax=Frondihabitans sp. 762G35 TaxID=1446794 RepID=UPI000D20C2C3|nr:oligosaccharide flippase family protein [Frondihabitans sp. 762G35]ARC57763.1 Putative mycofactocin biosynthesis glycosyltransferase MftF [Frondihabitans sp. 762G35]